MSKKDNPVLFVLYPKENVMYDEFGNSHLSGWSHAVDATAEVLISMINDDITDKMKYDLYFIFEGKSFGFMEKDVVDIKAIEYLSGQFIGVVKESIQIKRQMMGGE